MSLDNTTRKYSERQQSAARSCEQVENLLMWINVLRVRLRGFGMLHTMQDTDCYCCQCMQNVGTVSQPTATLACSLVTTHSMMAVTCSSKE